MLIVINTWKRRELFAATLSSVRTHKHWDVDVGVVDDHTWFWREPPGLEYCWRPRWHLGVGYARRFALECCLTTKHDSFLVMDNDLLVTEGFDSGMLDLWHEYRHRHPGCIASPYRSDRKEHLDRDIDFGPYTFSTATAGCMMLLDRPIIANLLNRMPYQFWNTYWDWALCGFINGCIKPRISYARHIGQDDVAVHKL